MYQCNLCGANVDASEIHNGICDDCIEEARRKAERQSVLHEQISVEHDGQVVMKEAIEKVNNKNGERRMNEIKLVKMRFENFKSFKMREVEFGNATSISGRNAEGKTTIADGYNWLFFDKNFGLKSNPTVRPEKNGVVENDVLVSVEAICEMNGKEVSFKKVQRQTKTKDGVVNGSANSFSINSVEKNKGDLEKYIEEELGISMSTFTACVNPNMFLSQNQKDMRPVLFKMATSRSDMDIALSVDELKPLAELMEKYSIEEISAMNKASVSKLDKEIDAIPVRIDELSKQVVDVDVSEKELQRNALKEQISEKEKMLSDNVKICEEFQKASDGILECNFKMNGIYQEANDNLIKKRRETKHIIDAEEDKFNEAHKKQTSEELCIERLKKDIAKNEEERNLLKESYMYASSVEFDESKWVFDENATICPNCEREYPADRINQIKSDFMNKKKKAIDDFTSSKEKTLESISVKGTTLVQLIKRDTQAIADAEERIKKYKDEKISANGLKNKAMEELKAIPEKPDLSGNQEYDQLVLECEQKKKAMDSMNNGADYRTQITSEISRIREELEEVNAVIASADNSKMEDRIEELEAEKLTLSQKRAGCRKILDMCDTLSKTKNELQVDEINAKFSIVKWQLFDYQLNGKYKEVCVPTIDGYRFGDTTNQGREIAAKLDICNSIQKFFSVNVPLFLDGAESINDENIPNVDCQLVILEVTKIKGLKVEVE
ncbi:MAG: AAA family ATPase [Clostridium sp.]